MPRQGDPRNGHRYRTACAITLHNSNICHLCGHPDAQTVDHIIPKSKWLLTHTTYTGLNDLTNLAPAHGTKGTTNNPCPTCGQLCNQKRGDKPIQPLPSTRSRQW